jgi:hypothetical protein
MAKGRDEVDALCLAVDDLGHLHGRVNRDRGGGRLRGRLRGRLSSGRSGGGHGDGSQQKEDGLGDGDHCLKGVYSEKRRGECGGKCRGAKEGEWKAEEKTVRFARSFICLRRELKRSG